MVRKVGRETTGPWQSVDVEMCCTWMCQHFKKGNSLKQCSTVDFSFVKDLPDNEASLSLNGIKRVNR